MDKEKEAKSILEKVLTMLSSNSDESVVSEEIKEDVVAEVEMSEEKDSDKSIEVAKEVEEVVEEPVKADLSAEPSYVTKEDFDVFKAELKSILGDEIKKKEEESIKLQEKVVELSAQPAAEPVVHSPEMSGQDQAGFQISSNRRKTTLDNVMSKLNKFK